jgi:ankyrin repeat protein
MTPFLEASSAGSLAIVKYMEEQGADINRVTDDGRTILHVAAKGNCIKTLEHLLQSPKLTHSLSTRTKNGRTVLLCAVQAGSVDTARFIFERSSCAEILRKTDDGCTCLHYAVVSGKSKMLSLFKDSGICHHDQTREGFTALHLAVSGSNPTVMQTLLDHIDRKTLTTQNPFANPVLIDSSAMLQDHHGLWTVDDFVSGRRLNLPTNSGKTALQLLLSADPFTPNHYSMFKDLISRVGIDLELVDREKKTPLVALAGRFSSDYGTVGYRLAIKELLDRGVNTNAQDISGRTALHYLCDSRVFGPFIYQAIIDLIGIEARLADVLSIAPPPPPPQAWPSAPPLRGRPGRAMRPVKETGRPSGPPPPPPPSLGAKSQPRKSEIASNKSDIARVDILDQTKETALQAFFRNLNRTHNNDYPIEIAIRLLDLSPKNVLNRQLPNGSRLFNIAIIFKNDKLINKLYDLGINTEERDSTLELRSPLELFCINGAREVEVLRKLISVCKNLTEFDFKGLSLLHLASSFGHVKVVRELLDGGIDVNIECPHRVTALSHAIFRGHTPVVELLLDSGATRKADCSVS